VVDNFVLFVIQIYYLCFICVVTMGQKEHMNLYYFIILPLFEQIGHADTLKNTLQFLN